MSVGSAASVAVIVCVPAVLSETVKKGMSRRPGTCSWAGARPGIGAREVHRARVLATRSPNGSEGATVNDSVPPAGFPGTPMTSGVIEPRLKEVAAAGVTMHHARAREA